MLVVAGEVWDQATAMQLLPVILPVAAVLPFLIARWLRVPGGNGGGSVTTSLVA